MTRRIEEPLKMSVIQLDVKDESGKRTQKSKIQVIEVSHHDMERNTWTTDVSMRGASNCAHVDGIEVTETLIVLKS